MWYLIRAEVGTYHLFYVLEWLYYVTYLVGISAQKDMNPLPYSGLKVAFYRIYLRIKMLAAVLLPRG